MSFLDYILAGFGIYEIKDDIIKQKQKRNETKKYVPNNFASTKEIKQTTIFKPQSNKMAFFCPKNIIQVVQIAKFLASNQPVLVDTSNLSHESLEKSLDFLIGAKTALDASMKRIDENLFVMLPNGTELVGFSEEEND